MKRQLAYQDIAKIKQLLKQLDIQDNLLSLDLEEGVVESQSFLMDKTGAVAENKPLSQAKTIAELARHAQLSQLTAHRYIQYCQRYFETEGGGITLSPYNTKLLQSLKKMFGQGLTVHQVMQKLQQGDEPVLPTQGSPTIVTPVDFARKYFESASLARLSGEEEEEAAAAEAKAPAWRRRSVRLSLAVLIPLILLTLISYQLGLGYLDAREIPSYPQYATSAALKWEGQRGVVEAGEKELPAPAAAHAPHAADPPAPTAPAEPEMPAPAPALAPAQITIDVLNGCGMRGAAGRFAGQLRDLGYQVREVTDAKSYTYTQSQIISRLEGDGAEGVMQLLPRAALLAAEPDDDQPMLTIILGRDDAS